MRAAVTGAAGFVGSHLAERLATSGHDVSGIDCLTPYYDVSVKQRNLERVREKGVRLHDVDLRSDELSSLLDDVEVVFHLAAQPGVRASWADGFAAYSEANVLATQRLLEAATRSGVRRVVYASSSSIYGNAPRYPTLEDQLPAPVSPYGVTKLAGEHLCAAYAANSDLEFVALRYFTVYGPRQRPDMAFHRMIESALTGTPFPLFGDGSQRRDFTFVADVVDATVRAGLAGPEVTGPINVAGGSDATVLDTIAMIEQIVGRPVPLDRRPAQAGDVQRTGGRTDRARELLGWTPTTELAVGLTAQVEWHHHR